jgi:hypothetical protein
MGGRMSGALGGSSPGAGEQGGADTGPPAAVGDVQVLDEAAPFGVLVEDHVHEPREAPAVVLGQDGHAAGRRGQPGRPDRSTLGLGTHVRKIPRPGHDPRSQGARPTPADQD